MAAEREHRFPGVDPNFRKKRQKTLLVEVDKGDSKESTEESSHSRKVDKKTNLV